MVWFRGHFGSFAILLLVLSDASSGRGLPRRPEGCRLHMCGITHELEPFVVFANRFEVPLIDRGCITSAWMAALA